MNDNNTRVSAEPTAPATERAKRHLLRITGKAGGGTDLRTALRRLLADASARPADDAPVPTQKSAADES